MYPQESAEAYQRFLGALIGEDGNKVGTCFQIRENVLVTAYHVFKDAVGTSGRESVRFVPLNGGGIGNARLHGYDEDHDLAVLWTETPLPASVPFLSRSKDIDPETKFHLQGPAELTESYDSEPYDFLPATGTFLGISLDQRGRTMARGYAPQVEPGMSGCPALREKDGAVIGVLSKRYHSGDGWSAGTIFMSCIESLEPLISDFDGIPLETKSPIPTKETSWISEVPLSRSKVIEDGFYFAPEEWREARKTAEKALGRGDILVVCSSPGFGATTFSERLLAEVTPGHMEINRLDPGDWKKPTSSAIPQKARKAYLLDLRDPDYDRPSREFVDDLAELGKWFCGMQSRLVVTIHDHLWQGQSSRARENLCLIRLQAPPSPYQLIRVHLENRDSSLLSILDDENLDSSFQGMTALKAQLAVETMVDTKSDLRSEGIEDPESVKEKIIEALDNHLTELDQLFGSKSTSQPGGRKDEVKSPLSLEDRCLLLALAFRKKSQFTQLERDSEKLAAKLTQKSNQISKGQAEGRAPVEVLSGPGLRGRLLAINATPAPSDSAEFTQPNFGEAVIRYVWDNYSSIRSQIFDWLMDLAVEDEDAIELVSRRLSKLIRQTQNVAFIKDEISKYVDTDAGEEVFSNVLAESVRDPHMRRQCERLLYNWSHALSFQSIVVDVCSGLLHTDRRDIALTRIRRVADYVSTPVEVKESIRKAFSGLIEDGSEEVKEWFYKATRSWFAKEQKSTSAILAFTALARSEVNGVPWLIAEVLEDAISSNMLKELVVYYSPEEFSRLILAPVFSSAGGNDQLYWRAVVLFCCIYESQGTMLKFSQLARHLKEIGGQIDRRLVDDLDEMKARKDSQDESSSAV